MSTEVKNQIGHAFEWEEAKPEALQQPAVTDSLFLNHKALPTEKQKQELRKPEVKKQESSKNNFVSERGINFHQKKGEKKPVYEMLNFKPEDPEEQNKKYLAYSQQNIKLESKSFSKTSTLFPRKQPPVPLFSSKDKFMLINKAIEENLNEADFYFSVALEVMAKKEDSKAAEEKPFIDHFKSRGSVPVSKEEQPQRLVALTEGDGGITDKSKADSQSKKAASNSSVVRRVLTMKSKREPNKFTMLF